MESKEQNKQPKYNKQTHRYREQTDGYYIGGVLGSWVKKMKRLRSINWWLQNSHRDVNYSIGNIVNDIVITMYGASWESRLIVGITS